MPGPQSSGDDKDSTVAKTAGFVVCSGIAMSILKAALSPFNKPRADTDPLAESTQPIHVPPNEPPIIIKKPVTCINEYVPEPQFVPKAPESSLRTVEIVRGDTLWGLSRKYGVSIEEIKEANGLSSDTIYAGKKLIIP